MPPIVNRPGAADDAGGRAEKPPDIIDILLIDDNADYLLLIRRALESHDARFRVTGVGSPEEAWTALEEQPFDLVLLDFRFPRGGNGLQVIRRLRGRSTYVPTVMITAFGDEGLAVQAMREGALDFMPKTADFIQALPEVVERALERGRTIRERIRAHQALERRNEELQVLNDIATSINSTRDADTILTTVQRHLMALLDASSSAIHRVDESGRFLLARAGVSPGAAEARLDLEEDHDNLLVRAMREGAVTVDTDEARRIERCAVPLTARHRKVGVMAFTLRVGRELQPSEGALLSAIGKQVGVAVEHARLYSTLAATESYLNDLVTNAMDEIVSIDPWGRITSWNAGAAQAYGWTAEEVVGLDWDLLWAADRTEEARALRREAMASDAGIRTHETVRVTRDGKKLDILLTLSPLRHPDGSHRGVSCIGKNVTSMKLLQGQLIQSEKMAAVGQLISGVAHELNNPLTGVLGYAQLVATVDTGEKLRGYLEKIAGEAARCQRIVQNLLAFARKHEPRASRVDVNGIVRGTLDLRAYDLRVNDVDVRAELGPDIPTTLADEHQLQQVFINIVSNAQQALAGRRGTLAISTRLEPQGLQGRPTVVVAFADDGPGVPEHLRETVFNPFFTTKPVGVGTGLGLSLSYGIVREHGGEMRLLETPGGGATFEVHLPILPELTEAVAAPVLIPQCRAVGPGPKKILVVDDQETIREMFEDILSRDGHDIESVGDGRQALRLIQDGTEYDLIIVDLKMPGFSGDRLYHEVKGSKPQQADRMLFASGDVVSPETRRFLEDTGSPFLPKPFGIEDVRSTVSSFFEERS